MLLVQFYFSDMLQLINQYFELPEKVAFHSGGSSFFGIDETGFSWLNPVEREIVCHIDYGEVGGCKIFKAIAVSAFIQISSSLFFPRGPPACLWKCSETCTASWTQEAPRN